MKNVKKLNQAGDTIIEVLIVLGILGLAFAVASVTAHASLTKSRNAQEHSVALGIVGSQIELVRSAVANDVTLPSNRPFCMTGQTAYKDTFAGAYTVPGNANDDTLSSTNGTDPYPPECIDNGLYHISLIYSNNNLLARVRWEGVSNLGHQQEIMDYRVYQL